MRRLVVIGVTVVLVIFMAIIVKGCVDGQRKDSLQAYNQKVNELGTESAANVTKALQTLSSPDNTRPQEQRAEIDRLALPRRISPSRPGRSRRPVASPRQRSI